MKLKTLEITHQGRNCSRQLYNCTEIEYNMAGRKYQCTFQSSWENYTFSCLPAEAPTPASMALSLKDNPTPFWRFWNVWCSWKCAGEPFLDWRLWVSACRCEPWLSRASADLGLSSAFSGVRPAASAFSFRNSSFSQMSKSLHPFFHFP